MTFSLYVSIDVHVFEAYLDLDSSYLLRFICNCRKVIALLWYIYQYLLNKITLIHHTQSKDGDILCVSINVFFFFPRLLGFTMVICLQLYIQL